MSQVYVAVSEITVPDAGVAALTTSFRSRLGAVDAWPGFLGLEVLQSRRRPEEFLMITRWKSRAHFLAYMRSPDHRASHARIPRGPHRARGVGFDDYHLVAQ
ncbi:MAG: antibiotic biosynthesis monooxygenase [Candidatus Dormibacteria bacterium]